MMRSEDESPVVSSHQRAQLESFLEDDSDEVTIEFRPINNTNEEEQHEVDASGKNSPPRQQLDISPYDPFSPNSSQGRNSSAAQHSLLDDDDDDSTTANLLDSTTRRGPLPTTSTIPGAAGFLEMEEEPPRTETELPNIPEEPIRTSSGLILTHRKTPLENRRNHRYNNVVDHDDKHRKKERFEVEHPYFSSRHGNNHQDWLPKVRKLLSYVRVWVVVSAVLLFIGTTVVLHHVRHETTADSSSSSETAATTTNLRSSSINFDAPIVFVPLPKKSGGVVLPQNEPYIYYTPPQQQHPAVVQYPNQNHNNFISTHGNRRLVEFHYNLLRHEFEQWISQHHKQYASPHEKEQRFHIWSTNHHRTAEKNARHGPCQLTNQVVFGSNHFKDLSEVEFRSQYLTGYNGPLADHEPVRNNVGVLGPHNVKPQRHPEVHRRMQEKWRFGDVHTVRTSGSSSSSNGFLGGCEWYDVSCMLTYVFQTYLYGLGTTMEPKYDSDSYPEAVDWRDVGAVTQVRAQGNCGACWAITSVETVESAVFISTGELYDLSETEVIVCTEDCEMCAGGWPQDAFEYIIDHGGIPLQNDMSYDGDWLLELSNTKAGGGDELDEGDVDNYMNQICPDGGGGNSKSGSDSNDAGENEENANAYSSNNYARYGKIEGYGYATSKCVCYSDGTGCDCDSQNEGVAVRNIATYGPAVVCFDASTWQDYSGGVITVDSGCSSGFMDVNHCAQVVGYAYVSDNEEGSRDDGGSGSGSGDKSGSQDNSNRSGYWIVRNQWSSYWGMSGYAYVAMGDNTCGILNDIVIAYA